MTCLMVLAGSFLVLAIDTPEKRWPSILPSFLIALGLLMSAFTYSFTRAPVWEQVIVGTLPSATMTAFVLAILTRAMSKKPEHRDSPAPAAS